MFEPTWTQIVSNDIFCQLFMRIGETNDQIRPDEWFWAIFNWLQRDLISLWVNLKPTLNSNLTQLGVLSIFCLLIGTNNNGYILITYWWSIELVRSWILVDRSHVLAIITCYWFIIIPVAAWVCVVVVPKPVSNIGKWGSDNDKKNPGIKTKSSKLLHEVYKQICTNETWSNLTGLVYDKLGL